MVEGERSAVTDEASAAEGRVEVGRPAVLLVCGSLVYYHCAFRGSSLLSLVSDVLIVLLCSLAILGMLLRQMNISVPVDPLEWQISQDMANTIVACLANTVGAAESVLRVAATGHDKRLFLKSLYFAGGSHSLPLVNFGTSSFRCYNCLCWIVLVMSLLLCAKFGAHIQVHFSVLQEKRLFSRRSRCHVTLTFTHLPSRLFLQRLIPISMDCFQKLWLIPFGSLQCDCVYTFTL
nr:PREDICTED: uncharacterized protein LOC104000160 isoform X1 [Musa acuminata subsp. malaccensis]